MKTQERQFVFSRFNENALAGMTYKNAGNFYPDSSFIKAFEKNDAVLAITGFNQFGNVVMRAEGHGDNVWFFERLKKNESIQIFCDGVIYRGKGAAVFFPGGCPAIAFRDEKADLSGLLHGGWKSITQGITDNFFALWENAGGKKENTQIIFLPSICGNCLRYEEDGYDYFLKTILPIVEDMRPDDSHRFIYVTDQFINFDLTSLIINVSKEKGYKKINSIIECVCCSGGKENYWSYNRDDDKNNKYRNAAFIITG